MGSPKSDLYGWGTDAFERVWALEADFTITWPYTLYHELTEGKVSDLLQVITIAGSPIMTGTSAIGFRRKLVPELGFFGPVSGNVKPPAPLKPEEKPAKEEAKPVEKNWPSCRRPAAGVGSRAIQGWG